MEDLNGTQTTVGESPKEAFVDYKVNSTDISKTASDLSDHKNYVDSIPGAVGGTLTKIKENIALGIFIIIVVGYVVIAATGNVKNTFEYFGYFGLIVIAGIVYLVVNYYTNRKGKK